MEIKMGEFGTHHWRLFHEVCTSRYLNPAELRCNPKTHLALERQKQYPSVNTNNLFLYPTKLRLGAILPNHDDWDCLEDFEAEQLIKRVDRGMVNMGVVEVKLTRLGYRIGKELEKHLSTTNGDYQNFLEGWQEMGTVLKEIRSTAREIGEKS